jgi:prenyltransferase beta subunit
VHLHPIGLQLPTIALEDTMNRLSRSIVIALCLLLLGGRVAAAQEPLTDNAQRALQWLQCSQQQPNGQIGSGGNPVARSAEVALGLAAAGLTASAMRHDSASLADYLSTAVSTDVGTNGELLLARASQPDAGPTATVAAFLEASRSTSGATKGEYGTDIYSDALAILGLRAAGQTVPQDSVDFLKAQQKTDGGWSADNADQFGTDSNTTALALQALIGAGLPVSDPAIDKGFSYLQSVFDGGFGDAPALPPDPNSDELAIQAILAAGRQHDPAWSSRLDQSLSYLAGQQLASGPDRGAIASSFSELFATTLAPVSFLIRPLTVVGRSQTSISLLDCPASAAPSSSAIPSPTVRATTPPRLAQTGGPAGGERLPMLPAGGILLIAVGLLLRAWPGRASR